MGNIFTHFIKKNLNIQFYLSVKLVKNDDNNKKKLFAHNFFYLFFLFSEPIHSNIVFIVHSKITFSIARNVIMIGLLG